MGIPTDPEGDIMDIQNWGRKRLEASVLALADDLRKLYFEGDMMLLSDFSDLGQVIIGGTEIKATDKLK